MNSKRLLQVFTSLLLLCCIASACKPEEFLNIESPDIVQLKGERTIMVKQDGGVFAIAINSSGNPSVRMLGNTVDWISYKITDSESGKSELSVTVRENTETYERNASLKISCGGQEQLIVFRQKPKGSIILSSSIIEMPIDGGEFSIGVSANCEIDYDISVDWIKFAGKDRNDAENITLRFKVSPYYEYNKREGYITISGAGATEKVTVYQTFEEDFVLYSSDTFVVSADKQTICIDLRSNIDFTVKMPDADWITRVDTKSSSSHTCRFEIDRNESIDNRFADIVFVSDLGTENKVTVEQKGEKGFLLGSTEYYPDSEGETFEIKVKTNVELDLYCYDEWMSVQLNSTKDALRISVAKNDSGQYREGNIYVYGGNTGKSETIRIIQQSEGMAYIASESGITYCNAGEHTVHFIRNVSYTCTVSEDASSWISIKDVNSGIDDNVTLIVSEWNGDDDRTGTITFDYSDGKSDTYLLTQVPPGKIALIYDTYYHNHVDYEVRTSLEVLCDMDVRVEIPEDCTWLTLEDSYAETRSAPIERRYFTICIHPLEDQSRTYRTTVTVWTADKAANQKITFVIRPKVNTNDASSMQDIRESLMAFYRATDGDNWLNNSGWGTDEPIYDWYGISCNKERQGDDSDWTLSNLSLMFFENNLTGSIPSELFEIPILEEIIIRGNSIAEIESGISDAISLRELEISTNKTMIELPSDLFKSKSLETFEYSSTWEVAQYLDLPDFTGTNETLKKLVFPVTRIPEGLHHLKGLRHLELSGDGNSAESTFPDVCGLDELSVLGLSGLNIPHPIPEAIGNLTNLTILSIQECGLTGSFPESFGKLSKLNKLNLWNNNLTGNLPDCLVDFKDLKSVNIACNRLSIGHDSNEADKYLPEAILNAGYYEPYNFYPQLATPEEDDMQRSMLADIYESFNGAAWKNSTNWLREDVPVEDWYGVSVDDSYGLVERINLYGNNSVGMYPESLVEWDTYISGFRSIYGDFYLNMNISVDKLVGEPSSGVLHTHFYKDQWSSLFGSNIKEYINSDKLPVGISNFQLTDLEGEIHSSEDLFSRYKHVIICQIARYDRMFITNFADLLSIKRSLGNDVAIIVAGDNDSILHGLGKRFGDEFIYCRNAEVSKIKGMNINFDYHCFYALDYYTSYSPINRSFTETDILDYLTVIDCEKSLAIWHGFSWAGYNPNANNYGQQSGGTKSLKTYMGNLYDVKVTNKLSSDFTADGIVKTLQTAKIGNGINVVIMGDGFIDSHHTSGLYDEAMNEAYDALFMTEPYKSFKDRFNVYSVSVVSSNMFDDTPLEVIFRDGTHMEGKDSRVFEYALLAPTVNENNINNTLCIVLANNLRHAGTCSMYYDNSAVAYVSMKDFIDEYYLGTIQHESGGHGFTKLGDEYWYNDSKYASPDVFDDIHALGWYANLDTENDPDKVLWAKFLDIEDYTQTTGIFEGGASDYGKGVYRPSEDSMMKSSSLSGQGSTYNAPSREAIYKRIMELSGEEYSFEKFLEYDKINLQSGQVPTMRSKKGNSTPTSGKENEHSGPVVIRGTWRDAR